VQRLSRAQACVRPWVAMVAAYAVGLQLLFTGVVASHMVAGAPMSADPFVTCLGGGDSGVGDHDRSGRPVHRPSCVLCAVAMSAPATLPAVAIGVLQPNRNISDPWPVLSAAVTAKHRTPKLSQAPPQNA
jgi:hypothetical protein